MRTRPNARPVWSAFVLDLICIVLFAAGGKSAHDDSSTWWVIARIGWPYALACLLGWVFVLRRRWDPWQWRPAGIAVLASTYILGMVLRVISGRGIAIGFLVVAIVFLTVTMLGWRMVLGWVNRRRRATA